jgi:hypothetical protein
MIEDVVRFPAKLELDGFPNGDVLLQRKIEFLQSRPNHGVSRSIGSLRFESQFPSTEIPCALRIRALAEDRMSLAQTPIQEGMFESIPYLLSRVDPRLAVGGGARPQRFSRLLPWLPRAPCRLSRRFVGMLARWRCRL